MSEIEQFKEKIEQFKEILRKHGYSEKAIEAILKWYV